MHHRLSRYRQHQFELAKKWANLLADPSRVRYHSYLTRPTLRRGYAMRAVCGHVPRQIAAYVKRFKDLGAGMFAYVGDHSLAAQHINAYVFYKLLWDPTLDVDELMSAARIL